MVGWTEESVEKIIRRYAGHAAYTKALIRQINERKTYCKTTDKTTPAKAT